ncbi:MAG: DUF4956 domain-containing protein [Bacilli bacterium]|nr:DUF4956 domain-containing protein [Bacilli bacterium]
MFNSIIDGSISLQSALIIFISAVILGLIISVIHMKSDKCSKNMAITLATLPFLVSIVIIMVNGNLGTGIAAVGAFSLVRFRSIPGNSKDIAMIFFAMAVGLALGTGYVGYAVIVTIIGSILIFILSNTKYGESNNSRILRLTVPEDVDYTKEFNKIFEKYTTRHNLVKVKTTNLGSLFELAYEIDLKGNEKEFIDELRTRNGNLKVAIERNGLNNEEL